MTVSRKRKVQGGDVTEIDDLRATIDALTSRLRAVEDQLEITQLVAQYGPSVDSGSANATADLWTDDGTFEAVGAISMRGHDEISNTTSRSPVS